MYHAGLIVPGLQAPLLAQALPSTRLIEILPEEALSPSLPAMESELQHKPNGMGSQFALETWRDLSHLLHRHDAIPGAREWHRIVGLHREWLIWGDFVRKHQKALPMSEPCEEGQNWQDYLSDESDFISALRSDIECAAMTVSDLLARIQRDHELKKALEPYQRPSRQRFHLGDLAMALNGQMRLESPLPSPLLKKIADLLGQDIRRYIVLSNRSLYPHIASRFWTHRQYPIYLEGELDLEVIAALRDGRNRHGVGSMGWRLWAALKDPEDFRSVRSFAASVRLGEGTVRTLLRRNKKPSRETVDKLAAAFAPELRGEFIRAHNETYYPELVEQIEQGGLYPGQTIFIGRRVEDERKLQRFVQRPAHPARFLLGARNLFSDIPGIAVLARQLRLDPSLMSKMEAGLIGLQTEMLPAWLRLYERFGTPVELLRIGAAIEYGLAEDDPAWIHAQETPKRVRRGKLPDHLRSVRRSRAVANEAPAPATETETASEPPSIGLRKLYSTLERLVMEERRFGSDDEIELVYRREYVGRMERAQIVDGEFRSQIAIINHVRDMSAPAILEIHLAWPHHITEARLNLLRREAAKLAAESEGIQQIILIWSPLEANETVAAEKERRTLFAAS